MEDAKEIEEVVATASIDAGSRGEIIKHAKAIQQSIQQSQSFYSTLYRAHITFIQVAAHNTDDGPCVFPVPFTTTSIVEIVDRMPDGITNKIDLLKAGKCLKCWLGTTPQIIGGYNEITEEMTILHSLTPVMIPGSRKRRL